MENYEKEIMLLSKKHDKLQTLIHYVNKVNLEKEHKLQLRNKAVGVDCITKDEYNRNLDANLDDLLKRMKTFSYRPQAVKRVYIPKANGKLRPLGIPSYEDKLVQGVLAKVLNGVYEPRFLDCSYGFRPDRSAHDAIKAIRDIIYKRPIGWVVEADIKGFFDNMNHEWIIKFLRNDIADENLIRYIIRFLKAGIMDKGIMQESTLGAPQGGLISPYIANVYLHYVLDLWFEKVVKKHVKGEAYIIRYADDFLACFQYEEDAKSFYAVLPKRLAKFGLEIAEDKTRILPFGKGSGSKESFEFLGFSFHNGTVHKSFYVVVVLSSKKKMKAKRQAIKEWLYSVMHFPISDIVAKLNVKLLGHYHYYGVSGNTKSLSSFRNYCIKTLYSVLRRRGQKKRINWEEFKIFIKQSLIMNPNVYVKLW